LPRRIALLRGINLGAKRRVSMQQLRDALTKAGYADVRTLLRSGNVVLGSSASPAALEPDLAKTLGQEFGFEIAVLVRTRDELADMVANAPFADQADDPTR